MLRLSKFFVSIFAITWVAHAFAETTFTLIREGDTLYAEAPSCDEARRYTTELTQWTKAMGEPGLCNSKPLVVTTDACRKDLTGCLPSYVAKHAGLTNELDGPNCYNTALVMKGLLPNIRNSTADEIDFYLQPPTCVPREGKPQPGDLGVIRDDDTFHHKQQMQHAFIYVADDLVFEKEGQFPNMPFRLLNREATYGDYDVDPKTDLESTDPSKTHPYAGHIYAKYFVCRPLKDVTPTQAKVDASLAKAKTEIEKAEACVQSHVMTQTPFGSAAQKSLFAAIDDMATYEKQNGPNAESEKDEKDKFLFQALKLRLQGILAEFDPNGPYHNHWPDAEPQSPELNAFGAELKKSLAEIQVTPEKE